MPLAFSKFFKNIFRFNVFLLMLAQASANAQSLTQVVAYQATRKNWYNSIEALGTLKANEMVVLSASVTDTITEIHFEDGQRVSKGFVLAEMTGDEESAIVSEMTARMNEAKRQYNRVASLPKSGAVSKSLLDQRQREYKSALAQLEATKSRLKDRLIIAPFDGLLGLRNISVGALVAPGDEIVTISDDSVMKLDFSVSGIYINFLKPKLPIIAKSAAFPKIEFKGEVSSVDSIIDPTTRSIVIRALIKNKDLLLKPGLLMTIVLKHNFRQALVIPEEALIPSGAGNSVLVVNPDNQLVESRKVTIGTRKYGEVEIISGLKDSEQVITHGTLTAKPGEKVNVFALQKDGEGIQDILNRNGSNL